MLSLELSFRRPFEHDYLAVRDFQQIDRSVTLNNRREAR